jgi:glucose-6-phosphate 1-dehydrogenase
VVTWYLRSGKYLPVTETEVLVDLKPPPRGSLKTQSSSLQSFTDHTAEVLIRAVTGGRCRRGNGVVPLADTNS